MARISGHIFINTLLNSKCKEIILHCWGGTFLSKCLFDVFVEVVEASYRAVAALLLFNQHHLLEREAGGKPSYSVGKFGRRRLYVKLSHRITNIEKLTKCR